MVTVLVCREKEFLKQTIKKGDKAMGNKLCLKYEMILLTYYRVTILHINNLHINVVV